MLMLPDDDRTRFLPLLNLKGGVGKTTVTLNLAEALARILAALNATRRRVLIIDLDPQANLTQVIAPDLDRSSELTINDVLAKDVVGGGLQAIRPTSQAWGDIDVIPSELGLANRESEGGPTAPLRLRRALRGIDADARGYAYVLIDCNPSIGLLTVNALAVATAALVVTEAGRHASIGLETTLENVEKASELNPDLRVAGIIANKLDKRSGEETYRLEELRKTHGDLVWDPVIPHRAAIKTASGSGVPVHALREPAAVEVAGIFDQLATRVVEETR